MNFRETLKINNNGNLEIGGVDSVELAEKFGTPLYVIDEEYFREVARAFRNTILSCYGKGNVAYASKAFSTIAILKIAQDEGLCLDVVSGGEIYTALKAGFAPNKIYFHGNNKLIDELDLAISNGIGKIVIDNMSELPIINELAGKYKIKQKVLVRVNPNINAHTHEYVQTAKVDSKFGFSINNSDADNVILEISKYDNLEFYGLHCHIGSQLIDIEPFLTAVDIITEYSAKIIRMFGLRVQELNLGGGFAIHYTDDDPKFQPSDYSHYVKLIANRLRERDKELSLGTPEMTVEPGRSLIGEAGITLYTVGAIKDIKDVRKYVNVDGGMTDNIRPALYGAKYKVLCANKAKQTHDETVTIAGKCCESGDIIAKDVKLPAVEAGDILATLSTGAYGYSMANHYNRNLLPPVVLVYKGMADYIVKPESYEDLIRNDVVPNRLKVD